MSLSQSDIEEIRKEFATKDELYKECLLLSEIINLLFKKVNGESVAADFLKLSARMLKERSDEKKEPQL